MNNTFDPRNPRVKKAREKKLFFNPPVVIAFLTLFLILLFGGAFLIYLKYSIGWLVAGFSALPFMFVFWIKNSLNEIPVKKTDNFTDLVSEDLLSLLNRNQTPADLIAIIPKTRSGFFLMTRFGLTIPFFENVKDYLPKAIEPVFETAKIIREKTNSEAITGAILATALIENLPNYETLLNQLKLNLSDLYQGIVWFNYLHGIVNNSKKPVHSGGIARDFAFGFTPTLQRFATNLSARYTGANDKIQQAENASIYEKIIHTFTTAGRQNVLLVGAYGSGRTTLVSSFAEILMNADSKIPNSLRFRQIYSLDAPSLISAARNRGEIEYIMIKILNEIYSAKNIILCLDNAHLFFEEGPGSVDIANLLTPVLEAGKIRIILIMDDQKFLEISAKNSALANLLNKIIVTPSNEEETLKILMDQVPYFEYQMNVIYTYRSLLEAYRLSQQYIHDVEMPGKAKLLLESAASYTRNGLVTEESVQTAIEKSYGVKLKVAENEAEREKLLNLESLIHERMIDQEEAVSAVSNALRRAGAGVKNKGRPP